MSFLKLSSFISLFSRISSNGQFMKEIDGLRFIAIMPVLIFHISGYIRERFSGGMALLDYQTWWGNLIKNGSNGVELFFGISGFILSWPMLCREDLISRNFLGQFYLRRLTRLEPPYLIAMTLFAGLLILRMAPPTKTLQSLGASSVYLHNFFYGRPSTINVVTWTLEIEFQYYLLAPILVYLLKKLAFKVRLFILPLLISTLSLLNLVHRQELLYLLPFLHFFLAGVFAADLYLHVRWNSLRPNMAVWSGWVWLLLLFTFFSIDFRRSPMEHLVFSVTLVLLLLFSLNLPSLISKNFLTNPLVFLIGGMCYSIYLLHYPIISIVGQAMLAWNIPIGIFFISTLIIILIASACFFLIVEKPTMIKGWYKQSLKQVYKTVFSTSKIIYNEINHRSPGI